MLKNIALFVLALVVVESYLLLSPRNLRRSDTERTQNQATVNTRGTPPRIALLTKGAKLSDSPLYKFAYQIAPGDLSASAESALYGWNIKQDKQLDNSILVTLTPKDSDDQNQQYTVKEGNALYFIEQTPVDDKSGNVDKNLRDDYGVIVDGNGIVQ